MEFGIVSTVVTAVLTFIAVMAPFFMGPGGLLASASAIKSSEQLRQVKLGLVKRYLVDEQAFERGEISKRAWQARKEFLFRRFIDTARRLDYVEGQS